MSGETSAATTSVVDAINAVLPAEVRAYARDDVPALRPTAYVEVSLGRYTGAEPRAAGQTKRRGYRIACRGVAELGTSDVSNALDLCDQALLNKVLAIADETTTPIRLDSDDIPGPDDGWFSGLRLYTFVL